MALLLAVLLSVTLSAPFGEASAELIGFTPEQVTVEVSVEVLEPAALVLLRGEDVAGIELQPVALLQREDGTWGAVVELPARRDVLIAFELIPDRGGSTLSAASTLVQLGIDPQRLTLVDTPEPVDSDTPIAGLPWIILATVTGVGALALLAFWSLRGNRTVEDHAGDENLAVAPDDAEKQPADSS